MGILPSKPPAQREPYREVVERRIGEERARQQIARDRGARRVEQEATKMLDLLLDEWRRVYDDELLENVAYG